MRFVTIDGFNDLRQVDIKGVSALGAVAVGIASSSEVDTVRIGSHVLGPCGLVPYDATVTAVRGRRTGNLPNGSAAVAVGQKLVLQVYECGDALVPPGPRAPVFVSAPPFVCPAALSGATAVLRLPFAGRKQAVFGVQLSGSDTAGVLARVRGVRYGSFDYQRTAGADVADLWFVDNADVTVTTTDTGLEGENQATVFMVGGGGDNRESFDELELYVYGAGAPTVICWGEASGEMVS